MCIFVFPATFIDIFCGFFCVNQFLSSSFKFLFESVIQFSLLSFVIASVSIFFFFHMLCSVFVWIFHDSTFANMSLVMYKNTIIILYGDQLDVITLVRWDYEKLKQSENNWIMIVLLFFSLQLKHFFVLCKRA